MYIGRKAKMYICTYTHITYLHIYMCSYRYVCMYTSMGIKNLRASSLNTIWPQLVVKAVQAHKSLGWSDNDWTFASVA